MGGLDGLIAAEIARLRSRHESTLDRFVGGTVSDDEVDAARHELSTRTGRADLADDARVHIDAIVAVDHPEPWWRPIERLDLSPVERLIVLVALAPEIHTAYDALFAYLGGAADRPWPTVDVAVRLASADPGAAARVRELVAPAGHLVASGLIESPHGPDERTRSSGLRARLALHPALSAALTGLPLPFPPGTRLVDPDETQVASTGEVSSTVGDPVEAALLAASPGRGGGDPADVVVIRGSASRAGRRLAAVAARAGRPLLWVDGEAVGGARADLARDLGVLQAITGALTAVAIDDLDDSGWWAGGAVLIGRPSVVVAPSGSGRVRLPRSVRSTEVDLSGDGDDRRRWWDRALATAGASLDGASLDEEVGARELADRFDLDEREIQSIVGAVVARGPAQNGGGRALTTTALAREAGRRHAVDLAGVARHVDRDVGWDQLVVPSVTASQLRHVADAIRYRHRVAREWRIGNQSGRGGVAVVFAGPSGTGKTLAASVLARELGLDLYAVNLAAVVSKYVGETEKNLERVFGAADRAGAMLLFDEADALFGKRSEVRDAHDRYANVEVAYLLQRLESHRSPVVLASNLSHHLDEAFSRRFAAVVEFPRPGVRERAQLWELMLGHHLDRASDVDVSVLADRVVLTGGEIASVALDAATRSAAGDGVLRLDDLRAALAHVVPGRSQSI